MKTHKNTIAMIGNKNLLGYKQSEESKEKMIENRLGKNGHKHTKRTKKLLSKLMKKRNIGNHPVKLHWNRIDKEVIELEKKGFHCIPIGKVVPDIIAIKNGKLYAIEIEYSKKLNYTKYDKDNFGKRFNEIIWLKM